MQLEAGGSLAAYLPEFAAEVAFTRGAEEVALDCFLARASLLGVAWRGWRAVMPADPAAAKQMRAHAAVRDGAAGVRACVRACLQLMAASPRLPGP